jgi:hypothetical protein
VAPNTVDIWKGRTQDFTAIVEGKNDPDQTVVWSVSGNSSTDTQFKDNILHVAEDEIEEQFTVTATSKHDTTKSGSSTVNLVRPTVTGVTILQEDAAIHKGGSMEFNATVDGPRGPDQDVTWTVEGNSSAGTKFEGNKLTIAEDERNTSWKVKATSYFDGEKSGTVTVKLAYKIDIPHSPQGKISTLFDGLLCEVAPEGREITVVVEPLPRFKLTGLKYTNGSNLNNSIKTNTKTFTMPASDITISAEFGAFAVGDRGPGGGWIFYVEQDASKVTTQGWKYLESAPTDISGTVQWGPSSEVGVSTPNNNGQGKANTNKIIRAPGTYPAASSTNAYKSNGLSGWYLPCQKELEELKSALATNKDFQASLRSQSYWSSSEEYTLNNRDKGKRVWALQLKSSSSSSSTIMAKNVSLSVRPVRQF